MPDLPSSPTPSEQKKQIVAAKNLLFGTRYFLIFSLPEGWGITRSYLEPDVHSTVGGPAIQIREDRASCPLEAAVQVGLLKWKSSS